MYHIYPPEFFTKEGLPAGLSAEVFNVGGSIYEGGFTPHYFYICHFDTERERSEKSRYTFHSVYLRDLSPAVAGLEMTIIFLYSRFDSFLRNA